MNTYREALDLLELGTPLERKLNARLAGEMTASLRQWWCQRERQWSVFGWLFSLLGGGRSTSLEEDQPVLERLLIWLRLTIAELSNQFTAWGSLYAEAQRRCAHAINDDEVAQFVLDFARELGATRRQLRGDRKALHRWFGLDAVTDRYLHRRAATERKLAWCLGRLGVLSAEWLSGDPSTQRERWNQLELEKTAAPLLRHDGDSRVAVAAFRCLSEALRALSADCAEQLVRDDTLAFIYRAALDSRQATWIQCEAIALLQHLSLSSLSQVLETRLSRPEGGDDLFVRRAAVRILGENLTRVPDLVRLLPLAVADPSPFVRQQLAFVLVSPTTPRAEASRAVTLACEDAVPSVRAAAIWHGRGLVRRGGELADEYLRLLGTVFARETDRFVLRVAIHAAAEVVPGLAAMGEFSPAVNAVLAALEQVHVTATDLAVRRCAAQARERIWADSDEKVRWLKQALSQEVGSLRPGTSRWLSRPWLRRDDEATIGRVLAVLAQEDFGYDLKWGWRGARITRGPVFRFRFWRFLHEMRHPDPAKRQAFQHTIGRASDADLRAPSGILAELAETKVPGEPLYIGSEAGWRPYLPLPDDVISCLNRGPFSRRVRFFTSEGVTELVPPRLPWRRLWAHLKLNTSFAQLARQRNWQEGDPVSPTVYLRSLVRLGFGVTFHSHASHSPTRQRGGISQTLAGVSGCDGSVDPAVARFFPALLPFAGLDDTAVDFAQRFTNYFISAFENSAGELAAFMGLVGAFFLGRAWYLTATLRDARRRIPLVLGGWGTRGKSGTERLKAGLINALGHGLVSKTTGCEAMFLHAPAYGKTRELFLYRSYDKATIWEQRMIVQLATSLGAEVFLWECMGLTPAYVEILQQSWMTDDLSTLTNTYPDHEDVQGPAGINIPQVMTHFIPTRSRLVTSEEQMRPILRESALGKGTPMRSVGWLEAGMIPPDVLGRFPYEEHPFNIALVLAVADELGVSEDFALKEMADRVVPDLGVLKTTPETCVRTRRLRFSNGMSANERHGCLNNWVRLGFDKQDPEAEPGVWLSTVVNNRADRIPRSRVFAAILVNDLSADRHFLIGGNLSGLLSYTREAWDEWVRNVTLWPETDPNNPAGVLANYARRFRRPTSEQGVRARLGVMLAGVGVPAELAETCIEPARLKQELQSRNIDASLIDSAVEHLSADRQAVEEYRGLSDRLGNVPTGARRELDVKLRELLWKWFESKLVVVADYHATGDQIIDLIISRTPPGFLNRVMGIQNIKGTGLDFVYRWEAWCACHRLCTQARDPDPQRAEAGLRELSHFNDFGVVSEAFVRATLEAIEVGPLGKREDVREQLALVRAHLEARMGGVRAALTSQVRKGGWFADAVSAIETVLDVSAALRRRRRANQIYADLVTERISQDRAVRELQEVTKAQKGGWLMKWIQKR